MWSVPKKKFPPLKNGRKNLMLFHKGNKKKKAQNCLSSLRIFNFEQEILAQRVSYEKISENLRFELKR